MRKNLVPAALAMAALGVLLYFAGRFGLFSRLSDYDQLVEFMRREGAAGPLICVGVQFVQVVIFAIPGEITQFAAGYVFGAVRGFLYSVAGIMLGSAFNYSFARLVGRPVMERFMGERLLNKVDGLLESRKGKSALFVLFLLPGMPKDAMSYGAGLSRLGMGEFIVISGLARAPALLFSTLIGAQLYERDYRAIAVTAVVGLVAIGGFYWYETRRRAHGHGAP